MAEPYHRFVFSDDGLVGAFEAMYQAEETEGFDSWHQDDLTLHEDVLQLVAGIRFGSVLDIGCGKGALLSQIPAERVVGIDVSETALRTARERIPHGEFRCGDALDLPPGERFELVMLVSVLHYIPRWQELLERVAAIAERALVLAYIPDSTVGTVPSIHALRDEVERLFTVERETGTGPLWGVLATSATSRLSPW